MDGAHLSITGPAWFLVGVLLRHCYDQWQATHAARFDPRRHKRGAG